jgi:DNA polymerase III delta prime subunit
MSTALLVILDGPQGCGKTTVAPYLAQAFGCTHIHDDEPSPRTVAMDLYAGRRVLVCTYSGFEPWEDQNAPTLRITINGDHPTLTLWNLLAALQQPEGCAALRRVCGSDL